jgi:hypothetical protein
MNRALWIAFAVIILAGLVAAYYTSGRGRDR